MTRVSQTTEEGGVFSVFGCEIGGGYGSDLSLNAWNKEVCIAVGKIVNG